MSGSGEWNDLDIGGTDNLTKPVTRRDSDEQATRNLTQSRQPRNYSSSENTSPVSFRERPLEEGGACSQPLDRSRSLQQSTLQPRQTTQPNRPDANGNYMHQDDYNPATDKTPRSARFADRRDPKPTTDKNFDSALTSVLGELDKEESRSRRDPSEMFQNNFDDADTPGDFNIPTHSGGAGMRPGVQTGYTRSQDSAQNSGNQTRATQRTQTGAAGNDQRQDPIQQMLTSLVNDGQNRNDRVDPYASFPGGRPIRTEKEMKALFSKDVERSEKTGMPLPPKRQTERIDPFANYPGGRPANIKTEKEMKELFKNDVERCEKTGMPLRPKKTEQIDPFANCPGGRPAKIKTEKEMRELFKNDVERCEKTGMPLPPHKQTKNRNEGNGSPMGFGSMAGLLGRGRGMGIESLLGGGGSGMNPLLPFMGGGGRGGGTSEGGNPYAGLPGGMGGNPFAAMARGGGGGMGGGGFGGLMSRLGVAGGGQQMPQAGRSFMGGEDPMAAAMATLQRGGVVNNNEPINLLSQLMGQTGTGGAGGSGMGESEADMMGQLLAQTDIGGGGGGLGRGGVSASQQDLVRQLMGQAGVGEEPGGGGVGRGGVSASQQDLVRSLMGQAGVGEEPVINPDQATDQEVIHQLLAYEMMRAQNNSSPRAEQAMHTILIVDTSGSMDGEPLREAGQFISQFINGLEELQFEYNLQENVALVSVGAGIQVVQHFTNDYSRLRRATDSLSAQGSSRLHMGLLVPIALLSQGSHDDRGMGGVYHIGNHAACPRVIFISDGFPYPVDDVLGQTPNPNDPNLLKLQNLSLELTQNVREKTLANVYCVPVGNSNMNFLEMLSQSTGGKVVQSADAKRMSRSILHHVLYAKLQENGSQRPTRENVAELLRQITATADEDDINGVFAVIDEGEPDIAARDQHVAQELAQTMGRVHGGIQGGVPGGRGGMPMFGGGRMPGAGGMPMFGGGRMPVAGGMPMLGGGRMPGAGGMPMFGGGRMPGAGGMPMLGGGRMPMAGGGDMPFLGGGGGGQAGDIGGSFGALGGLLSGVGRGNRGGVGSGDPHNVGEIGEQKGGIGAFQEMMKGMAKNEGNVEDNVTGDDNMIGRGLTQERVEELLQSRSNNPFNRGKAIRKKQDNAESRTNDDRTDEETLTESSRGRRDYREERDDEPVILGMGAQLAGDKHDQTRAGTQRGGLGTLREGVSGGSSGNMRHNTTIDTSDDEEPVILGMGALDTGYKDGKSKSQRKGNREEREEEQPNENGLGLMRGLGDEGVASGNRYYSSRDEERRERRSNADAYKGRSSNQPPNVRNAAVSPDDNKEPVLGLIPQGNSREENNGQGQRMLNNIPPMGNGRDASGNAPRIGLMAGFDDDDRENDELVNKLTSMIRQGRPRGGGLLGNDAIDDDEGDGSGLLGGLPDILSVDRERGLQRNPRNPQRRGGEFLPGLDTYMQNLSRDARTVTNAGRANTDSDRDIDGDVVMRGLGLTGGTGHEPSNTSIDDRAESLLDPPAQVFRMPQEGFQIEDLFKNPDGSMPEFPSIEELMIQLTTPPPPETAEEKANKGFLS